MATTIHETEHSSHNSNVASLNPVTSHQTPASQGEAECSTHNPNPPTADQNETEHSSHEFDVASIEPINSAIAHQAFKEQRPTLMIAISSSPLLVNQLYADDVIAKSVLNKLTVIGISKDEKNMILLNSVEDKIETDPSAFMTFVSALQSEPALEEMARQLLHYYRKSSDTYWYLCLKSYKMSETNHQSYPSSLGQRIAAVNQGNTTTCCGPIARYANYLKAYYDTSPISQDYKWPLTPSTQYINLAIIKSEPVSREQADEFTRLTLHGDIDQVLHKKERIEITDILKSKWGEKIRFVMVEGAPGVGKSTLAWELCRRWDKMEALKQYSLVVLLKLRDKGIQNATRVADFFYHADTDLQKAVVKEVKAREGEGVLLIMDGADECPRSFWKDGSLAFQILSGYLLPKANVLVTTRPSASSTLTSQWKPQNRIEVLGFTSDQIYQYTEHILGSEPDVLKGFHKYISSSPSIRGLLYIPLNTVIAVGVYRENRKKDKPIPTTLTQLYTDLILTLLQRYLFDFKLVEDASALPQTIEDFPESAYQQFLDLAEVAYEGTIGQRLVFQKLPEGSKPLGFTTASAELHTGIRLSYNFLHLTLQEYLAAFYFSQLPTDQQQEIFLEHHSTSHLSVMWTFVAGLTHFKGVGLDTVRSEYFVKYSGVKKIQAFSNLLPLLYEIQEEESIQAFFGFGEVANGDDQLYWDATPFEYFCLGYCVAHSKCTWTLTLTLNSERAEMFFLGVKSQFQAFCCIHNLNVRGSKLRENIELLRNLPLSGIRNLTLSYCGLDGDSLKVLGHTIIPGMDSLECLNINNNPVGTGDMVELLQILSMVKSLHTLNLRELTLHCDDIRALAPRVAPQEGSLRKLIIGSYKMEAAAVEKMLTMLFAESSLQSLSLYDIIDLQLSIRTDYFEELLEKNPNLQTLQLLRCNRRLITMCAKALCKNTILENFHVTDSVIEKDITDVLSEVLRKNKSLKKLNFAKTSYGIRTRGSIDKDGAAVLIDALQYNQTLQKMTLPYKLKSTFEFSIADPRIVFQ